MPDPVSDDLTELDLVHQLARRLRRTEVETSRWGLSPHQARALQVLARHTTAEAPGMRIGDLALRLQIAPRSATEVADALEQHGLLERRADPADRRAVLLVPTEHGRAVATQIRQERRRVGGPVLSVLSTDERTELRRLLTRLLQTDWRSDRAAGADPPSRSSLKT